jgi:hypothetical protein
MHTSMILRINAWLAPVEFYRVMPVEQAYQELSMYLGGLASAEKPIPEIDDVTMAGAKGFDKHSFRKDPGKKNRKEARRLRRLKQNQRSPSAGEYGTGRTADRKRQQGDQTKPHP